MRNGITTTPDSTQLQKMLPETKFTFDNFIVLECNRFAHESAVAFASNPKGSGSLLISGDYWLGKSHLMHAIGNSLLDSNPGMRIVFTTGEQFMNEFITGLRFNKVEQFRGKYCHVDVLLFKDLHFLVGHPATQEELVRTIDTLELSGGLIVMTALTRLDPALSSLIAGFLNVQIETPSLSDREIFVSRWAESNKIQVPESVIKLIAEGSDNINSIQGDFFMQGMLGIQKMLAGLNAYCQFLSVPISLEKAEDFFKEWAETRCMPTGADWS